MHTRMYMTVHMYVCMCALLPSLGPHTSNFGSRVTRMPHPQYAQLLTPSVPRPGHAVSCRPP